MPGLHSRIPRPLRLLVALAGVFAAAGASAVELTDGSLSVDLDSDGGFGSVFLEGFDVDATSDVQRILGGTCFFFANPSPIEVLGDTATYSGECGASFSVDVTSRLLGPVPGDPDLSGVLEQTFVFTNTSGVGTPLDVLTEVDPALAQTIDDVAAYDAATGSITAVDEFEPISMTVTASTPDKATFGWDVGPAGTQSVLFPTANRSGPVGPDDVTFVMGFDFGAVPDQASRTVTFTYVFRVAPVPDPFLCYKTSAKFKEDVSLADRFDSGTYTAKKFGTLCSPVDVDGEGIQDEDTFLSGFRLKGPHAGRSQLTLEDRFGTLVFDTKKTDSLLLPTDVFGPPLDVHYRCVKAKTSKGTPKLQKGLSAGLADTLGFRTASLKKPTKICVPTTFGGGAPPSSSQYLVCYRIKASPKNKSAEADVANEFGSGFITVKKEAELCVPAAVPES